MIDLDRPPISWRLSDLDEPDKDAPTILSTFSSGGGSSMGYKLAGGRMVGAVDIDPQTMDSYRLNLDTPNTIVAGVGDVLKRQDLLEGWQGIDILDGSPPCTTFSMAGSREKNWGKEKHFREGQSRQILDQLFFDYLDLVDALRPKAFIAENVKGMILGNARGYVRKVVEESEKIGYDVQVWLLNASSYGVAQHRERVFFVGRRKDLGFEPARIPAKTSDGLTAGDALAGLTCSERCKCDLPTPWYRQLWANTPTGDSGKHFYEKTRGRTAGFSHFKLSPRRAAVTLSSGSTFYHWDEPRRLHDSEYRRIGGFPDDYRVPSESPVEYIKYLTGMSVPPYLSAAVARSAFEMIGK